MVPIFDPQPYSVCFQQCKNSFCSSKPEEVAVHPGSEVLCGMVWKAQPPKTQAAELFGNFSKGTPFWLATKGGPKGETGAVQGTASYFASMTLSSRKIPFERQREGQFPFEGCHYQGGGIFVGIVVEGPQGPCVKQSRVGMVVQGSKICRSPVPRVTGCAD